MLGRVAFFCCVLVGNVFCSIISVLDSSMSIQSALQSALPGDTIQIGPGTYTGMSNCDLTINTSSITVQGIGGVQNTIIDCKKMSRCLSISAVGVTIQGVQFKNGLASNTPLITTRTDSNRRNVLQQFRNLPRKAFTSALMFSIQFYSTPDGGFIHRFISSNNDKKKKKNKRKPSIRAVTAPLSPSNSFGGCILIRPNSNVVLDNVLISDCAAISGAGLVASNSVISIKNSRFQNSGIRILDASVLSSLYGGGAYIVNSTVSLSNSTFANNYLQNNATANVYGGGLFLSLCSVTMRGPITLVNNSLSSLNGGWLYGGGMYLDTCKNTIITGLLSANSHMLSSSGYGFGGGMGFVSCTNIYIVGPIEANGNTITASKSSNVHGGGIDFFGCVNTAIVGPLSICNNRVISTGDGYLFGGGLEFSSSSNATIIGPITASNNILKSTGRAFLIGGAFFFRSCTLMNIVGPLLVENNIFDASIPQIATTAPYQQPTWNGNDPACSATTISQTSGTLTDGSTAQYAPNLKCTWLISLPPIDQAIGQFVLTFTRFDIEENRDLLFVYDGSSTQSPLIGRYSGSLKNAQCSSGKCPTLSTPITTSSGAVFLTFTTNLDVQQSGFSMSWTTLRGDRTSGSNSIMIDSPYSAPCYANGGGIAMVSSDLIINNALFRNNAVTNPFFSSGAAIFTLTGKMTLTNVGFYNNTVSGIVVGGAAIGASVQSLVTCQNCDFQGNTAVGMGDECYFSAILQISICGSVFGGSVTVISASVVNIFHSTFQSNSAICLANRVPCGIHGGSIAINHLSSSLKMDNFICNASQVHCFSSQPSLSLCPWSVGGCFYSDSASSTLSNGIIQNSQSFGIGNGGAVSTTGSSIFTSINVIFQNNSASQGGALGLQGLTSSLIQNSNFIQNSGEAIAGAALIVDSASVYFQSSSFVSNTASRASVMFSYNDDHTASYYADNISVVTPPGSNALLIGHINFTTDINNIWTCTWPGTVFSQDSTTEFFALSCNPCIVGTYSIGLASTKHVNRSCNACPFGAICLGSTQNSNGLQALGGFWGQVDDSTGFASFYSCPIGYCCPIQNTCEYDFCNGNRVGKLCGKCPEGMGLRFFTESCGPDDNCYDANWAIFVAIIGGAVMVVFLLVTTGHPSTGMLSVMLYFYQVLPLIKSTSWKYTFPQLIVALQSVFSMQPTVGDSESDGICVLKSMTAERKLGAKLLLQGIVILNLGLGYLIHMTIAKNILKFRDFPAKPSHYIATCARFLTIAYITMVLVPLQTVECVWINGEYVWLMDAETQCFESWQIGGVVAMVFLFPIPLLLIVLLTTKWKDEEKLDSPWKKETWRVLTNAFKPERKWWLGISLYRRLLLVLCYATITDANWKAIVTTVLCMSFLALNVAAMPFRSTTTQRAETLCLYILTIMAATESPQLSQLQFGTQYPISRQAAIEFLQFVLAIGPIIAYVVLTCARYMRKMRRRLLLKLEEKNGNANACGVELQEQQQQQHGVDWHWRDNNQQEFHYC